MRPGGSESDVQIQRHQSGVQLNTERLILRPIRLSDLDDVVALHREQSVIEFLGAVTREESRQRLQMSEQAWREDGYGLMAVIERSTGRFLGRVGLRRWPQLGETEVGWALSHEATGQGYATEAGRACLRWGFEDFELPYITAMIRPDNSRSLGVAGRLGMRRIRDDVLLGFPVIVHALRRETLSGATIEASAQAEELLDRVAGWAEAQPDLVAVALVGSRARGSARTGSDLDLVLLSWRPERYTQNEDWAQELGAGEIRASAHRGLLIEQRLKPAWGPELDVAIGTPRWASVSSLDAGTERVVRDGLRILYDPEGILARLEQAVRD